jgi:hypothetical protein
VKPVQSDTPRDQVNVSDCTGCRNRYSYDTYTWLSIVLTLHRHFKSKSDWAENTLLQQNIECQRYKQDRQSKWREQINFQWDDDEVHIVLDQHPWIVIELVHWNTRPWIDMSLQSDTVFWFLSNQSLLFLLNASCLADKQQIQIVYSLVWPDRSSNPQCTTLQARTLTITQPMRFVQNKNVEFVLHLISHI